MRNERNWKTSTQQVRDIRERKVGYERLGEIWETQQAEHPDDWLLSMEIFEILDETEEQPELKRKVQAFLETKKATDKGSLDVNRMGLPARRVSPARRPGHGSVGKLSRVP